MIYSNSEIKDLKKLIIHEPDEGIARISPKRAEELLFDDIVYFPEMVEEHRVFSQLLERFLGEQNVLKARKLLEEALSANSESKDELIRMILNYEELPKSYGALLKDLSAEELAEALITGRIMSKEITICDPIPNFIFTRDIAVTVNDHVIITKAAKEARYRENLLTRYIFWEHPLFADLKANKRIINLNLPDLFPPSLDGSYVNIEGGDMMILNQDYLLVGASERSNNHAFQSLKKVLFEKNVVENMVQVHIPNDRAFMHIDTLFTQVDEHLMVGYKPIVHEGHSSFVSVYNKSGERRIYPTLEDFIRAEIDSKMNFVYAGGGKSPDQEREQWTDGCNLLTIKPGVAIAYDRNVRTAEEFEKVGYTIKSAQEFLSDPSVDIESIEKTIFTLKSSELSRARGGSHCMSCPLLRIS